MDGPHANTVAAIAASSWHFYEGDAFSSEPLDGLVPFFGTLGAAWDDGMIARWSANPLGMLWPEMDAAFVTPGGETAARRQCRADRCSLSRRLVS